MARRLLEPLDAEYKRRARQIRSDYLHLDRIVALDRELDIVRKAIGFVSDCGGRADFGNLPAELSDFERRRALHLARLRPAIFIWEPSRKKEHLWVGITDKVKDVMQAEREALQDRDEDRLVVPIVKKLLMLCKNRKAPLSSVSALAAPCGIPKDFETGFIDRHSDCFRLAKSGVPRRGGDDIELISRDEGLAVTMREQAVSEGITPGFLGPYAFVNTYPRHFVADKLFWAQNDDFQRRAFPSPYDESGEADISVPAGEKRALAVFHELLGLTIEKRCDLGLLRPMREQLRLPTISWSAFLSCYPRIFYVSFRCGRRTAFLQEAYFESILKFRDPLVTIRNRWAGLLKVEYQEPKRKRKKIFYSDSELEF